LGEGERNCAFLSGSPSPKIGRRGWGMRAKGLECTQMVLNLELLLQYRDLEIFRKITSQADDLSIAHLKMRKSSVPA
jgi:hypothetical protein